MLRLKNVSKFYYNKGVIASGFTKANIEFDIGEFVVIIGESGSGKSTLLNVISGLDSYEEGEMYIDDNETSHYRECDFEEYRKKYVSNIFQNFNLINSYTVYQNVELVLLLNGYKRKEIKNKVLDLIGQVKLAKYKNTKVSKLSGGQKQRVAIARALAKETPIIVCDEPTGNLDSKSAKDVIKILKDVSKEKLVIIVTHDFPSVENIATRVVQMHDGKIMSDKKIQETPEVTNVVTADNNSKIGLVNTFRLGFRNTFNIIPKFLLILVVFLFITASLLTEYASSRKSDYEASKLGYNDYFSDTNDKRIIINKKDKSSISETDFEKIKKLSNTDYIVSNDVVLDTVVWFDTEDHNNYLSGFLRDVSLFSGELDYGRMPESNNEVVVLIDKSDYSFNYEKEAMLEKTFYYNSDKNNMSIKIVGYKFSDSSLVSYQNSYIYGTTGLLNKYMKLVNKNYSEGKILLNNTYYAMENGLGSSFDIEPTDRVPIGGAYVPNNINYTCSDYDCKYKSMSILISNLYFNDKLTVKISNVYDNDNVEALLGFKKDNISYGSIYINTKDYNNIFNKETYQSSVFVKDIDSIDDTELELNKLGFKTLQIRKTLNNDGSDSAKILKIAKLVVVIILVVTLFFISYFVIKLILKSRNVYYSTLRILGASFKNIKRILDVELFVNSTLAYILYVIFVLLIKNDLIEINFMKNICEYLKITDYVVMYIVLILMSYLISTRFSSKIFKKSAMKTYREEV